MQITPPTQGKKIVFVITKSNLGGAQKYVYELSVAAKKAGGDVVVLLGGTGRAGAALGPLAPQLTAAGIRVEKVQNFMRNMSPLRDVWAFFELRRLIKTEAPDVLHVTSSKAGALGALAGRTLGIRRIIFTSHGLTFNESWRPRWQRALIWCATWITMLLAHTSIMISRETYDTARLMPFLRKKVTCIYNGIHPIHFLERENARQALWPEHTDDGVWIGGLGELHPNKNWAVLITTIAHLKKKVCLAIIGGGEQESELRALIQRHALSDSVKLVGFVPNAAPLLTAFDIFVLPSKKEGLPYVLLEAGLAGNAVIASNISGNTDIIRHAETGLLISHDAHSLQAALTTLIEHPELRTTYGSQLKHSVQSCFTIDRMIEQTFALYEENFTIPTQAQGDTYLN